MAKKLYKDIEKVFVSPYGSCAISRLDYENLMIPMIAEELSDEQMQKLVDEINLSMRADYSDEELGWLQKYRDLGAENGLTPEQLNFADKMSEIEFMYFETCARKFGMRYWEDLDEDECNELQKELECAA
jgi:hypothetical protein